MFVGGIVAQVRVAKAGENAQCHMVLLATVFFVFLMFSFFFFSRFIYFYVITHHYVITAQLPTQVHTRVRRHPEPKTLKNRKPKPEPKTPPNRKKNRKNRSQPPGYKGVSNIKKQGFKGVSMIKKHVFFYTFFF